MHADGYYPDVADAGRCGRIRALPDGSQYPHFLLGDVAKQVDALGKREAGE